MTAPVAATPISSFSSSRAEEPEDHAASMRPLEAEFLRGANGPFGASTLGISLDGVGLRLVRQETAVIARVAAPPGVSVLAICLSIDRRAAWHGRPVDERTAISYASGAEHVGHSEGGFSVAILLSPEAVIAREAARLGLGERSQGPGTIRWIDPAGLAIRALRTTIERAIPIARDGRALECDAARSGLRATLTRLAAIATSQEPLCPTVRGGAASRIGVVRRAREYLDSRLTEPIYVADVCAATGVSERTLRYAFRDVYGIGPNHYLLRRRLHAARRALTDSEPRMSVTDAATRLGFWDLGRFAGYYRAVFGESPSATLRHSAGRLRRKSVE